MGYKTEVCDKNNINRLMAFLQEKWSREQMISTDRAFVDYTFFDKRTSRYNIIFAQNADSEIVGFIAYVPASFFDPDITRDFVWLTNWLVTEDAQDGAGIALFMKVRGLTKCNAIGTVGQNKMAEEIYKKMNFSIGALSHYFIVNENAERKIMAGYKQTSYKQTANESKKKPPLSHMDKFKELDSKEIMKIKQTTMPHKTARFIINKYLQSPYYKYHVRGIIRDGAAKGAIVFRVVRHNDSKCVRMVEYFGDIDALAQNETEFKNLLLEFNAEYLDFYCFGVDESVLQSSGFEKSTGDLIIPNYFEPFVNENIEIRFAYGLTDDCFTVYKGDGDRDFKRYGGLA